MKLLIPEERPPGDPSLIFENRDLIGEPAMHVLIAGVSDYAALPVAGESPAAGGYGMRRLSSTSVTAYLILDWLLRAAEENRLSRPLGTIRLLLSPTASEVAAIERRRDNYRLPTLGELRATRCDVQGFQDAARAWRVSARGTCRGATFFYFSGHGIQLSRNNQILLLDTFGGPGPLSRHGVDVSSMYYGMAPSKDYPGLGDLDSAGPDIARTQFYFVDACRSTPSQLLTVAEGAASAVFDNKITDAPDNRCAPIFYATFPGANAAAISGEQTVYSIALLRCLAGEAAQAPDEDADEDASDSRTAEKWHVSSLSLHTALPERIKEVCGAHGGSQSVRADGFGEDAVLCYLDDRPDVPYQVTVDPESEYARTRIVIREPSGRDPTHEFRGSAGTYPFRTRLKAGAYEFSATLEKPSPSLRDCPPVYRLVDPIKHRKWTARIRNGQ